MNPENSVPSALPPENAPSRRGFLKSAAAALAVGTAASAAAAPRGGNAQAWHEEFDVVIVGSGFSALAAAFEARRNGVKRIVVLEKMEVFGGNSAINGGQVSLPLNAKQREKGIQDSIDLMVADMLRAGRGFNHVELARVVAQESAACYDMMVECGVKFQDKVIRLGGHSAARTLIAANGSGGGIVVPMHKYLAERGVEFRNRVMMDEIVRDNSGVVGVRVREGYRFRDNDSGKPRAYRARLGVVMASGGWGSDRDFISTTMPSYATLECTSQKGATAETIQSLLGTGATPIMLDMYQLGPWACPDEFGAGAASLFADYVFADGIMVDPRNGRRFVNELASRRDRAEAQLKLIGDDGKPNFPFAFCTEETTKTAEGFKASWREGTTKRTNSVEELAKLYNASADGLRKQIEEWNAMVDQGKDTAFGKPIDRKIKLAPPFYSIRLWPKLHYCMGGVAITPRAEVIDVRTLKPIPGLFAAGEVTGGVHGMDRLGSSSSTDCLAFGRVAGRSVAKRFA